MSGHSDSELLQSYLAILRTQKLLSEHTTSAYEADLHELVNLAQKLVPPRTLTSLSYADIRRFSAQLHGRDLNARSIARKLSSWRGFYRWLAQQIDLPANPVEGVKAPKKSKPLPKALGVDDAMHLLDQKQEPRADIVAQSADLAMFELLYSSGLRVSELVSLDWRAFSEKDYQSASWLDLAEAQVHVSGKGNKQRIVPVGAHAITALTAWLEQRQSIANADPHALFLTARGTRMSVRLVQLRLKAHAQKTGIPADVHPHVLRHSFASHLLQSSGDLRAVQELLGHSSIAATQVYTALDFQHLSKVYDESHPRAKK
ncbi:MAG: tyrosine recombinase XerC [Burkholderiales bacterium]|nr:tyrosine recombinase XerC [Burkholderiales bacterium]